MATARRLTDKGVERLRPGEERQEIPDAAVPGLRLIVQTSGKKSWAVRTRVRGKTAKITVGPFPAYGVADAREAAKEVLQAAQRGEDPRQVAKADTVETIVADWLKRDQADNRGHADVARMFDREVLPKWRGRLVTEITRRDCLDLIDSIADRGAATYARRVHAHLHRFFRWSVGRGVLAINPMSDLPKPGAERPRDRVLSDAELVEIWKATDAIGWPFGPAVKLLILTGARRTEIGELQWPEIDGDTIQLAGERTKTGDPRSIPLSPQAAAIVEDLPALKPMKGKPEYVFTTTGRTAVSGWSRAKTLLDRSVKAARREADGEAKPIQDWRLHDLRRTVATGLQRLGFRLEVIEAVLGHVSGSRAGIVGVYQRHSFEAEKRRALDAWADHVDALVEGGENDNVVTLHA